MLFLCQQIVVRDNPKRDARHRFLQRLKMTFLLVFPQKS